MSEEKSYIGKLKRVTRFSGTQEEICEQICKERRLEKKSYNPDWKDVLFDGAYEEFIFPNDGSVWEIEKLDEVDPYFTTVDKVDEDTFDFRTHFYDGGTYLGEQLEKAIEEFKENEQ